MRVARAGALLLLLVLGACTSRRERLRYRPVVVMSPFRLPGVFVEGASRTWWKLATPAARYGEPLPVGVTMYCLQGITRRGRYVRGGIVAADPRLFPLAKYIELYVGRTYWGRFLVDDTGMRIHGARIDIWNASCREARKFGVARGTAVLVQRGPIDVMNPALASGAVRTKK